jgi:hypothetical protein
MLPISQATTFICSLEFYQDRNPKNPPIKKVYFMRPLKIYWPELFHRSYVRHVDFVFPPRDFVKPGFTYPVSHYYLYGSVNKNKKLVMFYCATTTKTSSFLSSLVLLLGI